MRKNELYAVAEPGYRHRSDLRVQYTGEYREPKAGEWFLSGAVVEGYRAQHDLTQPYHIARLVEVRTTTHYHVTGIVEV